MSDARAVSRHLRRRLGDGRRHRLLVTLQLIGSASGARFESPLGRPQPQVFIYDQLVIDPTTSYTSIPSKFVPSLGSLRYTSVPQPSNDTSSSPPPKYRANTLLIGNPSPSRGWMSWRAFSVASSLLIAACLFHRCTCSSMVALTPSPDVSVSVRNESNREVLIRCSLRVCENENRSFGVRMSDVGRPPPAKWC